MGSDLDTKKNRGGAPGRGALQEGSEAPSTHLRAGTLGLALGALGVVYGDIGTSPLYAIQLCFHGDHAFAPNYTNILGVLSLVFWSLMIAVSTKYIIFVVRADNKGDGGVWALMGLLSSRKVEMRPRLRQAVILAGIIGGSLLYADGMITPAISVVSAMEGLGVATKTLAPFIVPITCVILFLLFSIQRQGTGRIGRVFGPVIFIWFAVIGMFGAVGIAKNPLVLKAVIPFYAFKFFAANGFGGLVIVGAVLLVVTGCEALYADLGHFGKNAIRLSWFSVVLPALLLNYFGQGALLLSHPQLAYNPFYLLVPKTFLYPMVVLAAIATVIASQALISGVYSLTRQAIQMGFFPRLQILHTSRKIEGQIYIQKVNFAYMIACISLVIIFRGSEGLAAAYGVAVTGAMNITSILYFFVLTRAWGWPGWKAGPLVALFLIYDLLFFGSSLLKVPEGGWFTLAAALAIAVAMITWRDGRAELSRKMLSKRLPMEDFLKDIAAHNPTRVQGTAVFMSVSPTGVPSALLHYLVHSRVLHDKVIVLSIQTADIPTIPPSERVEFRDLGQGFYRVLAYYGFDETPNVPDIMELVSRFGLSAPIRETSFFLGRETLLTSGDSKMARWRKALFALMSRNSQTPMTYFGLPPNRVVEMGIQIEL